MAKLIQCFGVNLNRFYTNKLISRSTIVSVHRNYYNPTNKWLVHKLNTKSISPSLSMRVHRHFCDQKNLEQLMDFPRIVWPSVINTCKNWIMANVVIRQHFDQDFKLDEFTRGAKMALVTVSHAMADGRFELLRELLADNAFNEIKQKVSLMNVSQRHDLRVDNSDIFFAFPYEIATGVINSDDDPHIEKHFVEITMCYHTIKGYQELNKLAANETNTELANRMQICNYRFIRMFAVKDGKLVADNSWIINILNHFKTHAPDDFKY